MHALKELIKKLVGREVVSLYHRFLSWLAAVANSNPSEKLIVIGVTGTNGKSTTVNLIGRILEEAGNKVAVSSTISFKVGDQEWMNDRKMTMPGRFFLQKMLNNAVKLGCKYAVLEVTSQGIEQFRHQHINFDVCVFTNLTPEHIEAHGGFENYKRAKLKLFEHLQNSKPKPGSKKIIVGNADDPYVSEFINFKVDRVITFGRGEEAAVRGENLQANSDGINFRIRNVEFRLKLRGLFDFYNALAAVSTAEGLGISLEASKQALEKIMNVPGRMEIIEGKGFKVLVDYAPEPESLRQMYSTIASWPKNRIIHVLGSTGGGRDISRRNILGQIADKNANVVIVTNEDPYDDDPQTIIDDVAGGSSKAVKIIDRREAIAFALKSAQANDLVIITGKGAEQKMAVENGRYIDWDDRKVVGEELEKLK